MKASFPEFTVLVHEFYNYHAGILPLGINSLGIDTDTDTCTQTHTCNFRKLGTYWLLADNSLL